MCSKYKWNHLWNIYIYIYILCAMVQKRVCCKSSVDINYISQCMIWKLSDCEHYKHIYIYTYVQEIWKGQTAWISATHKKYCFLRVHIYLTSVIYAPQTPCKRPGNNWNVKPLQNYTRPSLNPAHRNPSVAWWPDDSAQPFNHHWSICDHSPKPNSNYSNPLAAHQISLHTKASI